MTEPAHLEPESDQPLHHALTLAEHGLRVVPILPGGKHPPVAAWQKAATTNPDTITNWWTNLYRDHGVGIALGTQPDGRHIFAIDIDHHHPNHNGHHTLQQLQQLNSELPPTVESHTGGNGQHILFEAPPGVTVRNQTSHSGRLGPGIDIRGEGGQIVVAPTIHPTGQPYTWIEGHAPWQHPIAQAPEWLLNLVTEPPTPPQPTSPTPLQPATISPAEILRQTWDWQHELQLAGWTRHHTDRNGDQHWTRPGKHPREGTSAVLHPGGPFVVFTTSIPDHWQHTGTPTRDHTGRAYSPFDFYTCQQHQGNRTAASRHIAQQHNLTTPLTELIHPNPTSPAAAGPDDNQPVSYDDALLNQLINWDEFWDTDHSAEDWIIAPVIAARRSHAIYAPGGTGKSLLSLWLCVGAATGNTMFGNPTTPKTVLYLDYEMTADDLSERLDSIGIHNPDDLHRLHYALLPSLPAADTPEGGQAIARLAELVNADIVVLDTFGRAVAGDENDADTVRAFYRNTGSLLKKAGRAFIRIDHAGKDITKGQRGTSAKNDDVDVVWQLTKTDAGIRLKANKRRMGWVPETVDLTVSDDPLTYDTLIRPGYPAGTKEAVDLLDELDIDTSWSARKVAQHLRDLGHKVRDRPLRMAVKIRKERLDDLVENAAQNSGRGKNSKKEVQRGPRSAAPPTTPHETLENTEKQRGPQKRAAVGRTPTPHATQRPPLRGAACQGQPETTTHQPVENPNPKPRRTLDEL